MQLMLKGFLIALTTLCLFACQPGGLGSGDLSNATGDSPTNTPDDTYTTAGAEGTVGAPSLEEVIETVHYKVLTIEWHGACPWPSVDRFLERLDANAISDPLIQQTIFTRVACGETPCSDAEPDDLIQYFFPSPIATMQTKAGYYLVFRIKPEFRESADYNHFFNPPQSIEELKDAVYYEKGEFVGERCVASLRDAELRPMNPPRDAVIIIPQDTQAPFKKIPSRRLENNSRTLWRIDTD